MTYPNTIPVFRAALLAYEPGEDHAEAVYGAQAQASPAVQCVEVFNALKAAPDLSNEGLGLLLGAAHLIAAGGWHGLAGEAATVLAERARQYEPSDG